MGLLDRWFGPPSVETFANSLLAALKRAGDVRTGTYIEKDCTIAFTEGEKQAGIANLSNVYAEHCKLPHGKRKQHIQELARSFLSFHRELPDDFESARVDLRPSVRTRSYFDNSKFQSEDQLDVPCMPVGDHLVAALVYDWRESMQFITGADLERWGVTLYEAMEAARQNLAEAPFQFGSLGEKVYLSLTGDAYDASRLLLLDFVRKLELAGDPIAIVANRDTLLITGSDDEEGLEMLAKLADERLADARPLSGIPLRLQGDEWESWMPDPAHPHYEKFRQLQLKTMYGEYSDQREPLQNYKDQLGLAQYVSDFTVNQKKSTGYVYSYCVWGKGVIALLPKTDVIFFVDQESGTMASAPWDKVRAVVGELMQEQEVYPPRFLVESFPTSEQLAAIGVESVKK